MSVSVQPVLEAPLKLSKTVAEAVRLAPSRNANNNADKAVRLSNIEHNDFGSTGS